MNLKQKQIPAVAILSALFLAILWGQVIWRLRGEWSGNPQYGFGWFTPVIALALGWLRWKSRPEPRPVSDSTKSHLLIGPALLAGMVFWSLTEALFITNPDWRLMGWISVIGASSLTLLFWGWIGGWPWLRHFAFASLFLLTAAPWPGRVEAEVTLALTDWITALTVESLNWIGIPALQIGNLIEMKSTQVGVEEACSGIRSLQVTLMVSLALGEFHRMNIVNRMKVLGLGVGLTFVSNYFRAFFLAYVAETQGGNAAVDRWHDTAGAAVLLISFVGLGLGAALMAPIRKRSSQKSAVPVLPSLGTAAIFSLVGFAFIPMLSFGLGNVWVQWRGAQFQESASDEGSPWLWELDLDSVAFESTEIPEAAQNLLQYDDAISGFIQKGAHRWQLYSIKWNPRRSVQHQVLGHQPEVCVTAVGWKFDGRIQSIKIQVDGVNLPFRRYSFLNGSRKLWVYRCEWEERFREQPESLMTHHSRWIAFWEGRIPEGIRMLEFAVQGIEESEADAGLRALLQEIIQKQF